MMRRSPSTPSQALRIELWGGTQRRERTSGDTITVFHQIFQSTIFGNCSLNTHQVWGIGDVRNPRIYQSNHSLLLEAGHVPRSSSPSCHYWRSHVVVPPTHAFILGTRSLPRLGYCKRCQIQAWTMRYILRLAARGLQQTETSPGHVRSNFKHSRSNGSWYPSLRLCEPNSSPRPAADCVCIISQRQPSAPVCAYKGLVSLRRHWRPYAANGRVLGDLKRWPCS
jgi:hypothetical protein